MESILRRPLTLDVFYDDLMCEDVTKTGTVLSFIVLMSFVSQSFDSSLTRRTVLQLYIVLFWTTMFLNVKCFED